MAMVRYHTVVFQNSSQYNQGSEMLLTSSFPLAFGNTVHSFMVRRQQIGIALLFNDVPYLA